MSCDVLLSDIIRDRASRDPDAPFAKVPRGNAYRNGYRVVTNSALVAAVDHVADLIKTTFGRGCNFERVAYLGLNDLRYTIVLLACIDTGHTVFFPSPRNSDEAHKALLESLGCSKLISTLPGPAGAEAVERAIATKLIIPTLDELLDVTPIRSPEKARRRTFAEARKDPIFVLHTSGSTGIPKALTYTNEFVSRVYHAQSLVPTDGFESVNQTYQQGACIVTLPPFHIAGLAFTVLVPAYYGSIPIYPIAGTPPGLEVFLGVLSATEADWAFVSPVLVNQIGRAPDVLSRVASKLDRLFYTGGSVPSDSGSAVARKMGLDQVLGSSECAAFPLQRAKGRRHEEDWQHVHVHPAANVEFRHHHADCYEMVQVRRLDEVAEGAGQRYQPVFCHFGGVESYATKDLFVKHASLPNTFTHVGRTDDIIVFLNGEKTNPTSFENQMAEHPRVQAALIVGQQRQEAALLVEPTDAQPLSDVAKKELIDTIWPTVEKCNKLCPRHAKVSKTKILVVPSAKSFIRVGKGTVQRRGTVELFKDAIDGLYEEGEGAAGRSQPLTSNAPDMALTRENSAAVVRRALADVGYEAQSPSTDSFQNGMDSLQAIQFGRALRSNLPQVSVKAGTIYDNPTVDSLAFALSRATLEESRSVVGMVDAEETLHVYQSKIDALFEPSGLILKPPEEADESTSTLESEGPILLTGSTGALGSHLLNTLLERGTQMVYCLNRSKDSKNAQIESNRKRGLPLAFSEDRVKFLDLALPQLGLQDSDFAELRRSVTRIIHNAWSVDFNKSLQSFADCLDGVVGLVDFAAASPHPVTVQFVSSIASAGGTGQDQIVPEAVLDSTRGPASTGYGQSKDVAEKMLAHASKVLGIRSMSVRVGQVSGDALRKRGWNRQEWLPSLVVSSLHLGVLPESLGCAEDGNEVRWIPVDSAARILHDMSRKTIATGGNETLNVVHPKPTPWAELLPAVQTVLDKVASERGGKPLEIVTYGEWCQKLKATSEVEPLDSQAMSANPAVKLLPFFENLLSEKPLFGAFAIDRAMASSESMRALEPLRSDCLQAWATKWIEGRDF
ncbi:acetyl-CoA synthetase-like protein [Hortaea werneckii]|nr:acetyl-CoA synthetase-like protein [Hortaea werneckii]KAI7311022.1 acetyl-CoA synthetase-like protein [Hortaea werneckii]